MIVLIDNYDSFTYNLAQMLLRLGAQLCVFRNDEICARDLDAKSPKGIVISPGPGTPATAGECCAIIRAFMERVPILGVCLGHQCIAEAFGGRILRAPEPVHGKTSLVYHDDTGVFAGLPNPFEAMRYHSLMVDPDSVRDDLIVSARTADGIVMGLRHRRYPLEGVQFHPESILTEFGDILVANFLTRCRMETSR